MSILWVRFSKASPHFSDWIPFRQEREGNEKIGTEEFVFLPPLELRSTFHKERHLSTYLSLSVIRV